MLIPDRVLPPISNILLFPYSLLLEAEKFNHQEVFIERAKICWAREKNTEAISVLEKGLLDQFQNATDVSKLTLDEKTICSKAKLLRARYIDEAANLGADLVFGCYQVVFTNFLKINIQKNKFILKFDLIGNC